MKHKNFIHEELYLYSRKQLLLLKKKYYSLGKLIMCNSGYVSNKLIWLPTYPFRLFI